MGLLDGMQQQPQQPQGGLLGGMAPQGATQPPAQPQGGGGGLQMAMQLAQNPTPEFAQQIAQQIAQKGTPEAKEMAQVLMQASSNPEAIKQFAQQIIQHLQGGAQ